MYERALRSPTEGRVSDAVPTELRVWTHESTRLQAEALREYLAKPGNLGAERWLRSKDFSRAEAEAIQRQLDSSARHA
jgi:hypothetical protein